MTCGKAGCARWVPQRGSEPFLEQEAGGENRQTCLQESSWLLGRAGEQGHHGGHREGCPPCLEGHLGQAELQLSHLNEFLLGNPMFTGFSPSLPSILPLLLHLLRTVRHPKPSHFHNVKPSRTEGSQALLPLPNVPSTGGKPGDFRRHFKELQIRLLPCSTHCLPRAPPAQQHHPSPSWKLCFHLGISQNTCSPKNQTQTCFSLNTHSFRTAQVAHSVTSLLLK